MVTLHPITDDYADYTESELAGLREDLRKHGLRVPVVLWRGEVVDGRHRVWCCDRLDIELRFEDITESCPSEADMRAHVASLNQHRRSRTAPLSNAEKRAKVEAALKDDSKRSDVAIAQEVGVSQPSVLRARKRLEAQDVIQCITSSERVAKNGQRGHGQHREIVRTGIRGAAPTDQRGAWRVGLTPDEQRAIVAKIKIPDHRALLDDLSLDMRQIIADNLSKHPHSVKAREREERAGKTVLVFNPLWYSSRLDSQTIRMMVAHRMEKRPDILAAGAAANDHQRYSVVSGLITPRMQVKTIRDKYPHLFDKEPPSVLHRHLGTVDDEETKALRDFASTLLNSFRAVDNSPASMQAELRKICACIRHCTDARSWDERLWALSNELIEERPKLKVV
jgi:DNA-binding Lrp family transcriptional regulator